MRFSAVALFLLIVSVPAHAQNEPPKPVPSPVVPVEQKPVVAEPATEPTQPKDVDAAVDADTSIRIFFIGDILHEASWQPNPPPPGALFDSVRDILIGADLVIGNLEEPLTNHPDRTPHKNADAVANGRDFVFRATSPDAARALYEGGIDIVSLANNHTMDYDVQGMLDTLDQLEAAEVAYAGGGRNLREADSVRVFTIKDVRIGIVGLSDVVPVFYWATASRPGISAAKYIRRVTEVIEAARPDVDILIVVFHWGPMFTSEPSERQIRWARAAVAAGADIVLGAHAHVLQGIGCEGRSPVVYSAGNFVFPTKNRWARRSAIFELNFDGADIQGVSVIPIQLDGVGRPAPSTPQQARVTQAEMEALSTALGTKWEDGAAVCRD